MNPEVRTSEPVMVHGFLRYHCHDCKKEWKMYLGKGVMEQDEMWCETQHPVLVMRCPFCLSPYANIVPHVKAEYTDPMELPAGAAGFFIGSRLDHCGMAIPCHLKKE